MTLLEKIKSDSLVARKNAIKEKTTENQNTAAIYSTFIGAIERIAVDERREITDVDVVKIAKKFLNGIIETTSLLSKQTASSDTEEDKIFEALAKADVEHKTIMLYVPKQMEQAELQAAIKTIVDAQEAPNKGSLLKALKTQFDGQYDNKLAADLVTRILANIL